MSFFKKIIKSFSNSTINENHQEENTITTNHSPLDDTFVKNFIEKGGKFIYCTTIKEVVKNIQLITKENNFRELLCYDNDLLKLANSSGIRANSFFSDRIPLFTSCEYLIANGGDILFSSNQLGNRRLNEFWDDFIVYATTSQIIKNTSEGLMGIKNNYAGNLPTNISSIKYYTLKKTEESFMNYGNTNSKNLYLLLFEDL